MSDTPSGRSTIQHFGLLISGGAAALWFVIATAIASRLQLVEDYATIVVAPDHLEPFATSNSTIAATLGTSVVWLMLVVRAQRTTFQPSVVIKAGALLLVAAIPPVSISLANILASADLPHLYWEPLWLSAWTGTSFAYLVAKTAEQQQASSASPRQAMVVVCCATFAVALWWFLQSGHYHRSFLLGFNDFGHFAQRVANTAAGRGFLLESPVLPPFWDHFNPGLALLVPLWLMWPEEQLFFCLQAVSLALGAILVFRISRQLGHTPPTALLWAFAWLAQPALGQMNLAYSYGWHPISLAIPLLLAAVSQLLAGRKWLPLLFAVTAMSMEEGVIALVALFCAGCAAACWLARSGGGGRREFGIHWGAWCAFSACAVVLFLVVYQVSGLAEFQTARFVALGNTATEVIFSPVLRPSAFWGELFRFEKGAFLLSLLLPCFLLSLMQGWRWLLPAALPLGILLVWDHRPASSMAFQYPSGLLPIFWLATLKGTQNWRPAAIAGSAAGALATGLVLSLYVGQLPYSRASLHDVSGYTYSAQSPVRRELGSADGEWLHEQLNRLHRRTARVLATGRIAAHFVGIEDIETVGQYLHRKPQLALLSDRRGAPLLHYEWIILDRVERFQQPLEETLRVEVEAREAGYEVVADRFDVVIFHRREPLPRR